MPSFRQRQAGDLFLGAYQLEGSTRKLVGYVCSTLSADESLTHESMSKHVPGSSSVCIHSVCVAKEYQRKGLGLALLTEYMKRIEEAKTNGAVNYERILLITHEPLRTFYEKAGFEWMGKSPVVHGPEPWFEMRRLLTSSPFQKKALEKKGPKLLSDFENQVEQVIFTDPDQPGRPLNTYDLLCPRPGCGSIILKKGVGSWVERESVQVRKYALTLPFSSSIFQLEPKDAAVSSLLQPIPTPPETAQWWLITPNPMAFENVGFTRPVNQSTSGKVFVLSVYASLIFCPGKPLALLTCAECEIGPLGWSEVGGSEFWLACHRVAYKV